MRQWFAKPEHQLSNHSSATVTTHVKWCAWGFSKSNLSHLNCLKDFSEPKT